MPTLLRLLVVLTILAPGVALAESVADDRVRLSDYLVSLNQSGHRIIFSSDVVTEDLVISPPSIALTTRENLAALLLPLGLTAETGPANSILIVRLGAPSSPERPSPIAVTPGVPLLPEVVVTSSLHQLRYAAPGNPVILDRELATRIPAAAEEAVRLPDRLPGVANGGISTRSYVRGGEANETLYLLDGLRLYEPFHLKDFQSVATVINSHAIAGMDFYAGAFPARFGDRMSSVMDISLRQPEKSPETELSLSFFNASVLSLGHFGGEHEGDWLFAGRRGNLDLIVDVVNPDVGSPDYRDFLGHAGWIFGPKAAISVNFLTSTDDIRLADAARGEQATARYNNRILWVKWNAEWNERWHSSTLISFTDIDNSRSGSVDLANVVSGQLDDRRDFRSIAFKQDWVYEPTANWMLGFGIDGKHLDGRYVFSSTRTLASPFDQIFDNEMIAVRDFNLIVDGAQYAAYAELRWRATNTITIDLGLRWDNQSYTTSDDDEQSSPRLSVLYQPSPKTELRLGWGQYSQAQEINELQVSDGNDHFHRAQRAEHLVLNLKRRLGGNLALDVSFFEKTFRSVRPRFENAFNQLSLVPELQFDRAMIDADSAESLGGEILLSRGSGTDDLFWWFGYTWSTVEDKIAGQTQKRSWDQTQTAKFGASWRWKNWDFSAAGEMHSGWPKTQLILESSTDSTGAEQLLLSTSSYNGARHSEFHTIDFRVSRDFDVRMGELKLFMEVSNVLDRSNPCCTEYSIVRDETGTSLLDSRTEHWLPLVPSLGVVWTF